MSLTEKYEAVIGLEVHAQLLTASKLFCGDSTAFGAAPNTQTSPVSLAHPGTLPVMNREAVDHAIKLGLAFGCEITRYNYFARKNYFYPDLPKGYQVSQHTTPICTKGHVTISVNEVSRPVALNRIHLEEDAGKSIHDPDGAYTRIDLNRAGVALLEIVTEPDLHSAEEAYVCLAEIRKMVRHLRICDGNMEEGSLRCDANVSIRKHGDRKLGTKVEVKNLNSIRNVRRAIEFEIGRLTQLAERKEPVVQQTRSFDAATGTTFSMRDKEEANDYRYFPEPDLAPFLVTEEKLASVRRALPVLPPAWEQKFSGTYGLPVADARILSEDRGMAEYYEEAVQHTVEYKALANWMLGPVKSHLNESGSTIGDLPLTPRTLVHLQELVSGGKVSFGMASTRIFRELLQHPGKSPLSVAEELNLIQEQDQHSLAAWVDEVLAGMPDKVAAYRKGKKNLIGLFSGEVKRLSHGKADMQAVHKILTQKLNQT